MLPIPERLRNVFDSSVPSLADNFLEISEIRVSPGRDFGDQKQPFLDQSIKVLCGNSFSMLDKRVGSIQVVPVAENWFPKFTIFYNIIL